VQKTPYQVIEMAQKLKADGKPSRRYKVRAILKWFGAKRRGDAIAQLIKTTFAQYGIKTVPDFSVTGSIEEQVHFELVLPTVVSKQTVLASADPPAEVSTLSLPVEGSNAAAPPPIAPQQTELEPAASDDQLEPENEEEPQQAKPDDHPVSSQVCDWTIGTLAGKIDNGLLDLQPHFQREYVWEQRPELPSRLIESILLRIPIPPIYFGRVAAGRLEVIDGQQRLTTLVKFIRNEFPLQKLQRLGSLNGKLFKDLSADQRAKIEDEPIRSIMIDAGENSELRYEVFERLNRGSMQLNEQELRNCVYRGPFNDLLATLETDQHWRKVKGGPEPEGRYKEREIILRFFAFAYRLPFYKSNLKAFLNSYIGQYAPKNEAELKEHAALFRQTMQNIYAVFGEHSARLYEQTTGKNAGRWDSKFSVTVFDIQAAALMNQSPAKVQQAAEQIRELFLYTILTDQEIKDAISRRTGSSLQTKIRFNKFATLVEPILKGTVTEPRFFDYAFRFSLWENSHTCKICNNEIHIFEDCTVDHIEPYSKGGKTIAGNAQLAHRFCNARKNDSYNNPSDAPQ
jgi:hypothetical protein